MNRPVGIDLGTTRSAVACVDENGQPRILSDASGVSLVPSVVLFDDAEVLVGELARDSAVAQPELVVDCVKRFIGDPEWRFVVGDRSHSAVEVSRWILGEMKRIAEEALDAPVTQAVVTVPAYFHDAERTGTIRAAELAGLEVLKIVNEPTAAAMTYDVAAQEGVREFLVYDLGGGTFDITVMRRRSRQSLETVCTRGNHHLGGKDWDERLVDFVATEFSQRHQTDPRADVMALHDLKARCEKAKIALSESHRTTIVCQFAGCSLPVEVTRPGFEELTADLLGLTETEVDRALAEAGLTPGEVERVLLVGGSVKMPMVHELMSRKARSLKMSKHSDHCVALGAALEAARLCAGTGLYKPAVRRLLTDTEVKDRTPHGLGVVVLGEDRLVNAVVIPKNTEVPCRMSREDLTTTYDAQTSVKVHLVQGEDEDAMVCVPTATYEFSGIPARDAGRSNLRVVYSYNENNVVEVSAFDVLSGRPLEKREEPLVDLLELSREYMERQEAEGVSRRRRVALLLDASGSMRGRHMDEAKKACHRFIQETDFRSVEMGLVQFGMSSKASIHHEMSQDPESLGRAVDRLRATGGTPMAEAIRLGTRLVMEGGDHVDHFLVLFTDGIPNNRSAALVAGEEAEGQGIDILCIGIGGADRSILDALTTMPGETHFPESGEELVGAFGNIAQLISGRRLHA